MRKVRELFPPRFNLAAIESFGGDESPGIPDRHAGFNRLRSESRKQRREDAAVLQSAKRGNIKLRHAAKQREHAVTLRYSTLRQHISKTIHRHAKRGIGEIADAVVARD